MKDAHKAEGYASSTFSKYATFLTAALNIQRREWNFAEQNLSQYESLDVRKVQKSSLIEKLMYKDTKMAFVLLWVLLEGERLQKRGSKFTDWSIPCLEIELDHSGGFRPLPTGEVYYEGAETKSAHTGTHTYALFVVNCISRSRRTLATRKKDSNDRCGIAYRIRQEGFIFCENLRPESRNNTIKQTRTLSLEIHKN